MSNPRWKVWRDVYGRWSAEPEDNIWSPPTFTDHAEALAYADRMARTVNVVLPSIASTENLDGRRRYWQVERTQANQTVVRRLLRDTGQESQQLHVNNRDLKPLALALLAHHYKEQQ